MPCNRAMSIPASRSLSKGLSVNQAAHGWCKAAIMLRLAAEIQSSGILWIQYKAANGCLIKIWHGGYAKLLLSGFMSWKMKLGAFLTVIQMAQSIKKPLLAKQL